MKKPWLLVAFVIGAVGVILYFIFQKTKQASSNLSRLSSSPLLAAANNLAGSYQQITQPGVNNPYATGAQVLNSIVGLFQLGRNPSINSAVDNFGISKAGTSIVYDDPNELPSTVNYSDVVGGYYDSVGSYGD